MKIGIISSYFEPTIDQIIKIKKIIAGKKHILITNKTAGDQFLLNFFSKKKFFIVDVDRLNIARNYIIENSDLIINMADPKYQKKYSIDINKRGKICLTI